MRVISGSARGTKLKMVPGDSTRPVMDRVKENFFNILGVWVPGTRWLDLFAGTGQVGIEALSRGAAEVVFTDNTRAAIKTIHQNLKSTRLTEKADVRHVDAFAFLGVVQAGRVEKFDMIYVAPPQYKELWVRSMALLSADPNAFLLEEGQIVVQIDPSEYDDRPWPNLDLVDSRKYGRTLLCFYEPTKKED